MIKSGDKVRIIAEGGNNYNYELKKIGSIFIVGCVTESGTNDSGRWLHTGKRDVGRGICESLVELIDRPEKIRKLIL